LSDGPNASPLSGRRILLDCRWLGLGGTGRVTELLLAELAAASPAGTWMLWGRPQLLNSMTFAGSIISPVHSDPRSLLGQRDTLQIPPHDIAVFMNQIRPLRLGPSVTMIHDTIALRYGGTRPIRMGKRMYFKVIAGLSTRLVTQSEFSLRSIARDLGVSEDRIDVVQLGVDDRRAAKIRELRGRLRAADRLLYVGQFRRHKNLKRLCLAFAESDFAERGGTLVLVGGEAKDAGVMADWVRDRGGELRISVRLVCPEDELLELMAESRALIVPSLEEGFGLPAFEAAAAGIPVAVTRTGAMSELPTESAVFFDPEQVDDIRRAIDEVVARVDPRPYTRPSRALAPVFLGAIEAALRDGDPLR
jgi:glycosyltransferase involved in cell wall biosynthesis